ncbi:MAG TPA: SpoIIE family protein phosphatase [Vicinamibacterales bacterium]|nr:SpoIIE family protein phosphatase [Vicinamibacterales bacterium]
MNSASSASLVRRWLTGTFSGRALLGGVAIKLVAIVLRGVFASSSVVESIDTIGDIAIVAAAVTIGYHLYVDIKGVVLWRVRRKLTLSYIFMGFVPATLIITFSLVAGLLLFYNVSAYSIRMRLQSVVDQANFLAETAALEVARSASESEIGQALRTRHDVAATRYPLASYGLLSSLKACGTGRDRGLALPQVEGAWVHMPPPSSVPDWVPCGGEGSLVLFKRGAVTHAVARAVQWVPGRPHEAVVVDLPIDAGVLVNLSSELGIDPGALSSGERDPIETYPADANVERALMTGVPGAETLGQKPAHGLWLPWIALLTHVNWTNGATGRLLMQFWMSPTAVYALLTGSQLSSFSFGQVLLILFGLLAVLFLIIQVVAFGMGLSLARSITGAVHELFEGTERVGRGDFTHKIPIRSRDQLGELAASFNSMTASIEYLLQEKAEKERLEQELRIARAIQMSLLPQGPLAVPGLALTPHCEPAREVGGDYYDYVPLDDDRVALLIADVSGKGTSAALYMAELKGIILSLSQQYTSPRQLLIKANQIISRHLDTRSFITITYAVVDLRSRTLTYARAGHCPLIYVPGPQAASRQAQILIPDGMVLGLQIDDGQLFSRALEEATVPLTTGDLFLFYTDGISETMNAEGDCFGDARLAALLERHADLPPAEIRERILREVQAFAGTAAQQDDMTMLLLGVGEGPAETAAREVAAVVS